MLKRIETEQLNIAGESIFSEREEEAERIFAEFKILGIWRQMDNIGYLEPAVRCAELACSSAKRLNEMAHLASIEPIVSPKVCYMTGLLFKSGRVIDDKLSQKYSLGEINPKNLNLYLYPAYAAERSVDSNNVLRLAVLLTKLDHLWFAKAILHGPHPQFFEKAELPTVLAALANANIALNDNREWHSYLHPAVGLFSIAPYAIRTDELAPTEAKDWIDRARVVALNTTLQHILRIYGNIQFTDENYSQVKDEQLQRWRVVKETFRQLGMEFPNLEEYIDQDRKNNLILKWISENQIEEKLIKKQEESGHLIHRHSLMVAELLRYMAKQLNELAMKYERHPVLNEGYLYNLGFIHDSIKAFSEDELGNVGKLKGYEAEFSHTYPAEVEALGTINLKNSHDAMLYAWMRHFEDNYTDSRDRGKHPAIANDLLSGPYHLYSLISGLLSYADLAVVTTQDDSVYHPDITERFLDTTLKYISDPHSAVIGYTKLMTLVATLSWYLDIRLPVDGAENLDEKNISKLTAKKEDNPKKVLENLRKIARIFSILGINIPNQLRKI